MCLAHLVYRIDSNTGAAVSLPRLCTNRQKTGGVSMRKRKTWWWLWLCPPLLACAEYFGRRAHATAQDRMLQFLKLLQDTHSAEAGAQFYKWKFLTALLPSLGLILLTAFVLVLAVLTLGKRLRWRQSVLLAAAAGLCLSCATALYVVPQQGWGSIPREILPWFVRSAVILSCAALLALALKHLPVYHGRFKKMVVMIGAAVLIAVLAALTVYDHNHRIIEWIARDGAGWLSRLLHRYLLPESYCSLGRVRAGFLHSVRDVGRAKNPVSTCRSFFRGSVAASLLNFNDTAANIHNRNAGAGALCLFTGLSWLYRRIFPSSAF